MAEKEYIDRNELIDDFQNDLINLHLDGLKGTPRPKEIKIVKVIERIEDFPATNVAPVIHGNWVYDKHFRFAECSECEAEFYICDLEEISGDGFINFCPNCGAKMDGDVSNVGNN